MRTNRRTRMMALTAAVAITVAACGGDDDDAAEVDDSVAEATEESDEMTEESDEMTEESDEMTEESDEMTEESDEMTEESDEMTEESDEMTDGGAAAVDLASVCPSPIVIQTDWFPEAEHGALYHMVGDDPEIDAGAKVVTGPLVTTDGSATGVDIEIRTGGPAIGFQQVVTTMAGDPDGITFGYVATDEAIENYADNPTTAFVAPLEVNPQIIMWDPETYPDVTSIADLQTAAGGDPVTIRYFETGAYMQFLLTDGQVIDEQLDGSYDGGPAVYIAEGGNIAQQGFASAEPYNYEFVFEDWLRPVEFELIHDAGWQGYAAPLAVLDSNKDALADCMAAFAPVVQAATVDYYSNPDETNALIIQAVNDYADFWVYDEGLAEFSVATQIELGLAGNGPDSTVGNFDEDRLVNFIEIAGPVFGVEGLTPADLVTNEYIDESIGF